MPPPVLIPQSATPIGFGSGSGGGGGGGSNPRTATSPIAADLDQACWVACQAGDAAEARRLANPGADVLASGGESGSPLLAACHEGHLAVLQALVAEIGPGCCLAGLMPNGATALHVACHQGQLPLVTWLVDAVRVDPNVVTTDGVPERLAAFAPWLQPDGGA